MHKFFQKKVKGKNIGQGEDARTHLFSVLGIIGSLSLSLCLWIGSKGEIHEVEGTWTFNRDKITGEDSTVHPIPGADRDDGRYRTNHRLT